MPFEDAYEGATQGFEGGYADDPADAGGETFNGISRRSHPGWPGWALIDEAKAEAGPVKGAALARAIDARFKGDPVMAGLLREFYKTNYWDPFSARRQNP
jgi:hypothetical protein